MPVARWTILADIQPLREYPDYRRLWLGSGLSAVGGQMTTFAVALQVFRISHSSAAVGAVGLAVAVPAITVGLFAGVLVDSVDRRRLVLVTSSLLALVSAAARLAGPRHMGLLFKMLVLQSSGLAPPPPFGDS